MEAAGAFWGDGMVALCVYHGDDVVVAEVEVGRDRRVRAGTAVRRTRVGREFVAETLQEDVTEPVLAQQQSHRDAILWCSSVSSFNGCVS
jgi:hypothetical protein